MSQKPLIKKIGTIDIDLVETTPIVFKDRLYRLEYVRRSYWNNKTEHEYFRFVDHETNEPTKAFADGYSFGNCFVENDIMYVTVTANWGGQRVEIFSSDDLENWQSWTALNLPGYGIYNTSLCKADDKYVLMFEIDNPPEEAGVKFTARFATSTDLKNWTVTPPECNYAKDRYTAPHALRYMDGYFYDFFLEGDYSTKFETCVVRSKDLINWQLSPLNPVLTPSKEDKIIANSNFTKSQLEQIKNAVNINTSDIDFCQYKGKLIINYTWGDQAGSEFLAEAEYDGSLEEFLKGWFPQ